MDQKILLPPNLATESEVRRPVWKQEGMPDQSTLHRRHHHFLIPNSPFLHPLIITNKIQANSWSFTNVESDLSTFISWRMKIKSVKPNRVDCLVSAGMLWALVPYLTQNPCNCWRYVFIKSAKCQFMCVCRYIYTHIFTYTYICVCVCFVCCSDRPKIRQEGCVHWVVSSWELGWSARAEGVKGVFSLGFCGSSCATSISCLNNNAILLWSCEAEKEKKKKRKKTLAQWWLRAVEPALAFLWPRAWEPAWLQLVHVTRFPLPAYFRE